MLQDPSRKGYLVQIWRNVAFNGNPMLMNHSDADGVCMFVCVYLKSPLCLLVLVIGRHNLGLTIVMFPAIIMFAQLSKIAQNGNENEYGYKM